MFEMTLVMTLRIAIVGHFLYNSGCSQAVLGYIRAAQRQEYDLRVSSLSLLDPIVTKRFPLAGPEWKPDILLLVFESYQYMSADVIACIEKTVPRAKRVIIDHDGKYSPAISSGNDSNHNSEEARREWLKLYERLSDKIVQPALGTPARGASRFLFFGVDTERIETKQRPVQKMYDIAYIGNNWYRWNDMSWFIQGVERIRSQLGRIAIFGKWWSGNPLPGVPEHTYSDPEFLRRHGVELHRSVRFGNVERTMGRAYLSPIFIRPILSCLEFATPRMFETFTADTVPLLAPNFHYSTALYGDSVAPLNMSSDPAERVEYALSHYPQMVDVARNIARELRVRHSYRVRLSELVELLA